MSTTADEAGNFEIEYLTLWTIFNDWRLPNRRVLQVICAILTHSNHIVLNGMFVYAFLTRTQHHILRAYIRLRISSSVSTSASIIFWISPKGM